MPAPSTLGMSLGPQLQIVLPQGMLPATTYLPVGSYHVFLGEALLQDELPAGVVRDSVLGKVPLLLAQPVPQHLVLGNHLPCLAHLQQHK